MDLFEIIKQKMELEDLDILNYSPLTLAYIGDCIYELVIRTIIVDEANRSVNKIHQAASSLVKAGTQSAMADYLMDSFSDEELAIYKRGRNSKVVTKAKNASMKEYKAATGFEAVMGYLYLTNRSDRMMELIKEGLNYVKSSSEEKEMRYNEYTIEGRNAITEAFKAGKTIDKLFVLEHIKESHINTIIKEARKQGTIVRFVPKERLDQMSETGAHQGVIAYVAAYEYATVEDILKNAEDKGEAPFVFVLDEIEDPHNLGAIIRTANLSGAHGVIIPKNRAAGLTSTVVKASAGAINYTPVAKVTNIAQTIDALKEKGIWFAAADMGGEPMYNIDLTGAIGIVIGNEGKGVSRLVKEKCDFIASIPMKGDIDSLNASVAAGVLAFEVVRQNMQK